MDVILISTTDMKGGRADVRDRMLRSMVESSLALGVDRMVLAMLLQNFDPKDLPSLAAVLPSVVRPVATPGRIPLSSARNIVLRHLAADGGIPADAMVAFPDDDCWYPPGFLVQVAALFARDETLDFWFCRYSSRPTQATFSDVAPTVARTGEVVRNASSNTIFLRGRVVAQIGDFDEALGVGTPMGGSEDLDYALRACRQARKIAYCDAALVGHRDTSHILRARYYLSGLVVLARHARHGAAKEFLRKIAVGVYLVLRRELAPLDFVTALRCALAEISGASGGAQRPLRVDR
jgi:hypothetical protein